MYHIIPQTARACSGSYVVEEKDIHVEITHLGRYSRKVHHWPTSRIQYRIRYTIGPHYYHHDYYYHDYNFYHDYNYYHDHNYHDFHLMEAEGRLSGRRP